MKSSIYRSLAVLLAALLNVEAFVSRSGDFGVSKSKSSLQMTLLTYGNKKKDFKPGTPMKKAVAQLGIKPKYSCNK